MMNLLKMYLSKKTKQKKMRIASIAMISLLEMMVQMIQNMEWFKREKIELNLLMMIRKGVLCATFAASVICKMACLAFLVHTNFAKIVCLTIWKLKLWTVKSWKSTACRLSARLNLKVKILKILEVQKFMPNISNSRKI